MIAGIASSARQSWKVQTPMYLSLRNILVKELFPKAVPFEVLYPRALNWRQISATVSPSAYFSKASFTMGAVLGSITSFLSSILYPRGIAPPIELCLQADSLIPRLIFWDSSALQNSAIPSSTDSRMIPSGSLLIFSVADISCTPLRFKRYLQVAESYRERAKRSSLYTITASNKPFSESFIILRNWTLFSISLLADVALSAYISTILILCRLQKSRQTRVCPSIDCSVWLWLENLTYRQAVFISSYMVLPPFYEINYPTLSLSPFRFSHIQVVIMLNLPCGVAERNASSSNCSSSVREISTFGQGESDKQNR